MSFASFFGRKKEKNKKPSAAEAIEERGIADIRELSFRYTVGSYANADVRYELELRDGVYYARVKLEGESYDDTSAVPVGDDAADEIAELLNTYDVILWDGFNKSERGVLDGDRFTFSVYYGDGDGISASGYMNFPEYYEEVCEGLDEIFRRFRDDR